jgi:hypothetical protein
MAMAENIKLPTFTSQPPVNINTATKINYKYYVIAICVILIIFICYCYHRYFNRVNNEPEILQTDFSDIVAQDLFLEKLPIIFRDEMFDWECICEIFELPIEEINKIIANEPIFSNLLKDYMSPFSLPLSTNWDYTITKRTTSDTYKHFILEQQHRHIIGQITGEQRIYLATPNQATHLNPLVKYNKNNKNNKNDTINENHFLVNKTYSLTNFWSEKETSNPDYAKLEYMEVVLRAGNILYIPYGWWYLEQVKEEGLVLEAKSKSILNWFF